MLINKSEKVAQVPALLKVVIWKEGTKVSIFKVPNAEILLLYGNDNLSTPIGDYLSLQPLLVPHIIH